MSTYIPIQAITPSSPASSVIFSGIPQTFTDLILVINGGMNTTTGYATALKFNSDSSSNYSSTYMIGNGSTATSGRYSSTGAMYVGGPAKNNLNGNIIIHIQNYSNATTNKIILVRSNRAADDVWAVVGSWRQNSAITQIEISPEFVASWLAGSTFTLYGFGTGSPKAFGGTTVTTDGTFWYHTFQASGVFEPLQNLTADVLVVAGGGGGGSEYIGGGGGAGGLRLIASQSLSSNNSYTCTVGGGGPGGSTGRPGKKGVNGSNSSFSGNGISTITTTGGGGGASTANSTTFESAGSGGSGGGGTDIHTSVGTGNAGLYSPVEGYSGGGNASATAGGGGGSGGIGGAGNGTVAGNGGIGSNSYNSINFSTWLTATKTGSSGYLAAGGGGAAFGSRTAGVGGSGGGGNGANQVSPINATDGQINTGSGGGGTERNGSGNGASGGSGLIIVRYSV